MAVRLGSTNHHTYFLSFTCTLLCKTYARIMRVKSCLHHTRVRKTNCRRQYSLKFSNHLPFHRLFITDTGSLTLTPEVISNVAYGP